MGIHDEHFDRQGSAAYLLDLQWGRRHNRYDAGRETPVIPKGQGSTCFDQIDLIGT